VRQSYRRNSPAFEKQNEVGPTQCVPTQHRQNDKASEDWSRPQQIPKVAPFEHMETRIGSPLGLEYAQLLAQYEAPVRSSDVAKVYSVSANPTTGIDDLTALHDRNWLP
jgi:hypothetical protein